MNPNPLDGIILARERLAKIIKTTPLIESDAYSQEYNAHIYLKAENLQKTGSFKIRGAYNKMASLSESERALGIVTASAGNHAQGVALAASLLGAKAVIVMSENTPLIKVDATRQYGASVVLHGNCFDDAYEKAMALKSAHGYTFIHPFDDQAVIDGQGTIGLEIMEQLPDVDMVLVPIGGGGLAAGVATAIKLTNPSVQVIGIEPKGARTLQYALEQGRVTPLSEVDTIAEGVAVKKAGQLTFEWIKTYVDQIVTVDDVSIMEAFLMVAEKEKLVVENAGVLSLAALNQLDVAGKKVVAILSGGNIDVVTMSELISRGLVSRGRIFCFAVELPDTPGQLQKIATILADLGANIIQLEHNQFKTIDRFKKVHLEVTCETHGKPHVTKIKNHLEASGYHVETVY